MSRSSLNTWDHGSNTIPVQFGTQIERPRSDHDNSIPIHFTSTSSMPSSAYGSPMSRPVYGATASQSTYPFPPSSFRPALLDPRFVAPHRGWPFDESPVLRGNTLGRFPIEPYPPVRILVVRTMPREPLPFPSTPGPRHPPQIQEPVHSFHDREAQIKLEQERVLKTLKRQVYSPSTRPSTRRLSLFSRNVAGKGKEPDEDSKRCSVCLEDFEAGSHVMVTPCNHVFHEECIVPWMKSNGQCPVCRFVVSERLKENATALSNASVPLPGLLEEEDGRFMSDHVLSVIRAMDEALSWGRTL